MKRSLFLLILSFLCYIVYYDLSKGTLPAVTTHAQEKIAEVSTVEVSHKGYESVKVQSGDTVLSVMESLNSSSSPNLSIEKSIKDFEALNPGTKAEQIVIGKTYKFPVYKK
ncbi:hypothetical protein [Metabacillus sp. RGM 3146]|uniref:hypothetical protein n=1 Tax=Metabacillus sp. RGM 3146 TaxID=3401092 RepID=UPI003B9CADC7